MEILGQTTSTCERCRALVPARVESDGEAVFFRKLCREHGESRVQVHDVVADYRRAQRFLKPAWVPRAFDGRAGGGCPDDCGFCARHEQHLCMPIIEITSRCDLACPVCLRSAVVEGGSDMSRQEFEHVIARLVATEAQIDLLNLSGGEPLLHPEVLAFVDHALAQPQIVRVSISTNGLALLARPHLVDELRRRNVVVSLQLDGWDDRIYETLRGRRLASQKREILDGLKAQDVTTSLTMTVAGGVNDQAVGEVVEEWRRRDNVVSLMLQPVAFVGRAARFREAWQRLSIPDVVRLVGRAGIPSIREEDFVPLPCSHPLCFALAFYLRLDDGGLVSVNRLADANRLLDSLANRVVFGLDEDEHAQLKGWIYELWSGPVGCAPEGAGVLRTLRGLLKSLGSTSSDNCCEFDARRLFERTERAVKSIFVHAFQDPETFDLARVRRCCQAYPQPDGRLLPACVRNVRGTT
jgi:7,8-dihydro-6-hydroxymethylpterin dimethyltransferase